MQRLGESNSSILSSCLFLLNFNYIWEPWTLTIRLNVTLMSLLIINKANMLYYFVLVIINSKRKCQAQVQFHLKFKCFFLFVCLFVWLNRSNEIQKFQNQAPWKIAISLRIVFLQSSRMQNWNYVIGLIRT